MITEDILLSLNEPLEETLNSFEVSTGMIFGKFANFEYNSQKAYSGSTKIPVIYGSKKVGDLIAVVFTKNDGTGNKSKEYNLENIIIPPEYRHKYSQERVIPRDKTDIICEGYFPLFSMNSQGIPIKFASCLDELGLVDKKLVKLWTLGQNESDFNKAIREEISLRPQIYLTVGKYPDGTPFGNPHAIYYSTSTDTIQVVGFFSITDQNSPMLNFSKRWIQPQPYK